MFAISLLRMCGGYCKLVHLARTTPTNLCEDSLKFFDEEVRLCFSSCVAIDVPDPQWQQAQLSPKLGGLRLRSLSLHSCAAFISSVASLEMGNPDNTHLQQAILRFNARVSPQGLHHHGICAQFSSPAEVAVSKAGFFRIPFSAVFSFPGEQGSNALSFFSPCQFLDYCYPFYTFETAP